MGASITSLSHKSIKSLLANASIVISGDIICKASNHTIFVKGDIYNESHG